MTTPPRTSLTVGTRTSQLALWQTDHIISLLQKAWPGLICHRQPYVTRGDKTLDKPLPEIGGKGLFTLELENALHEGAIDLAVHSLKDLPVENPPGLVLGAIVGRADVRDVLISRDDDATLDTLPQGAIVGTSSLRRRAQLLYARPDLQVRDIRGNVDTRIRKVLIGNYDATILAAAGVERLNLVARVSQHLPLSVMLPAPGQGALAVQCRADDEATLQILRAIETPHVRACVTAERAFLQELGGGCATPVAAYAQSIGATLRMTALVAGSDGSKIIVVEGTHTDPSALGEELAAGALEKGARELLAHAG